MDSTLLPRAELIAYYAGTEDPLPPGYRSQHLTDTYVLEYCFHGRGVLTINGSSHQVETGDIFFTFPDCLVSFRADEADPWAKSWICFSGTSVAAYLSALGITPYSPVLSCSRQPEMLEYLNTSRDVVNDTAQSPHMMRFRQSECAMHIFSMLSALTDCDRDSTPLSTQEHYAARAMHYIDNAVTTGDGVLSVDGIAKSLGLNRAYFSTVFSNCTGKSPRQYILERKMRHACTLFANPLSTASNVASTLGYELSPFCRIFKKTIGMTPIQYKEYIASQK